VLAHREFKIVDGDAFQVLFPDVAAHVVFAEAVIRFAKKGLPFFPLEVQLWVGARIKWMVKVWYLGLYDDPSP
jgi:hypothetical protein